MWCNEMPQKPDLDSELEDIIRKKIDELKSGG
jgi:hypothetical protein